MEGRSLKATKDLISGIVFLIFSSTYLALSTGIQEFKGKGSTPLTNRFIPYFWGIVLLILSLTLLIRGLKQLRKDRETKENTDAQNLNFKKLLNENSEVIICFFLIFFYLLLMQHIGFVVTTAVFIFLQTLNLTPKEKRRPLLSAVVGVASAILLYLIFCNMLHILLPAGILKL